jgi:hypothetical protein
MRRNAHGIAAISLAVLGLAGMASAQNTPAPAGYVPVQQYDELKQEVDALKQRLDADERRLPATQEAPTAAGATPAQSTAVGAAVVQSTSNQSAPNQALAGQVAANAGAQSGNVEIAPNLGGTVQSLFAPRTQQEYFTPFSIMNPDGMRPDMNLEVARYQDMHLYLGLDTVGRFQFLSQNNVFVKGVDQGNIDPGFQTPFADLNFLATIPGKLDVYFDEYIASRPHPDATYGHEGYLVVKGLPGTLDSQTLDQVFDYINVKLGAFDLDYGDQIYSRSNNAIVARNPLIGNSIVDPNTEEIGGEVYSVKGPIYWLAGMSSGTTTEHFDFGPEPAVHGKLWAYPLPDLRTSVSAYYANLSDSTAADEASHLYSAQRSGGVYAAVFGGGDNPGQITPQAGEDITAIQADATWNHWPYEVYGNYGYTSDSSYDERWTYASIQPVYHLTPALYVAARYSVGIAGAVNGVDTNGWGDRVQIGGGYFFTNNLLAKVEYVYQQFHDFTLADGLVSGVDAYRDPRFSGVVMEVSFSF